MSLMEGQIIAGSTQEASRNFRDSGCWEQIEHAQDVLKAELLKE
jgi:hypothetical protein